MNNHARGNGFFAEPALPQAQASGPLDWRGRPAPPRNRHHRAAGCLFSDAPLSLLARGCG